MTRSLSSIFSLKKAMILMHGFLSSRPRNKAGTIQMFTRLSIKSDKMTNPN